MKEKIIWITGASSGIGEALAYQLNKNGNKLIVSARRKEALELVRLNCEFPEKVAILPLDLSDFDALPHIAEQAIAIHGKIDVLINNGGISQRSLIAETKFEVFKKMIDVNYLGTIQLTNALLPHFITEKQGHFVTVTSLMGKFGSPYRSGYCGAKHALHGFFDVLRMEHEKDNIDVTLICPGFIQTNVAKNALTADGSAQEKQDEATANGLPVATCAKRIIRAMDKKKFEAYIGGKEIFAIYLKRIVPKLLHSVVLKSAVR
ncbi:SDR family oxidoreductase [Maribacter chungangensis]|uniref:SDR family oxidoreductase n=1 Tax=Maribacter chungangensis TaxID=1069117 RepID=A0ABW3B2S2_9FLAO